MRQARRGRRRCVFHPRTFRAPATRGSSHRRLRTWPDKSLKDTWRHEYRYIDQTQRNHRPGSGGTLPLLHFPDHAPRQLSAGAPVLQRARRGSSMQPLLSKVIIDQHCRSPRTQFPRPVPSMTPSVLCQPAKSRCQQLQSLRHPHPILLLNHCRRNLHYRYRSHHPPRSNHLSPLDGIGGVGQLRLRHDRKHVASPSRIWRVQPTERLLMMPHHPKQTSTMPSAARITGLACLDLPMRGKSLPLQRAPPLIVGPRRFLPTHNPHLPNRLHNPI